MSRAAIPVLPTKLKLSSAVILNMMQGTWMGKGISSLEGTITGKGFPVAETQRSLSGCRLEQKLSCSPLSTSKLFTCSYTT